MSVLFMLLNYHFCCCNSVLCVYILNLKIIQSAQHTHILEG
ncbi:hypothetical protein X975_03745, partial [Stegodyphus mimosarum]